MFGDSGKKIMALATIGFMFMCVIAVLATLMAIKEMGPGGGLVILFGGILLIFVNYIGFMMVHAFGEVVQGTKENRLLNEKEVNLLQEIKEENKRLAALLAQKEGPERSNAETDK